MPDSPSIEDVCSRVAEILREARTSQNLSLTRLAEKAALSRQAVSYIEQGRRIPALNTLLRIAGVLQLDLGEVIHRASKAA